MLEQRMLLSVTALFFGGTLDVSADAADTIVVRANVGGQLEILDQNGLLPISPAVNASAVTAILIAGSDSANVVDLSGVTAVQFTSLMNISVSTSDGDDVITGSPDFGDSVKAGDGNDTVFGAGGNDTLDGGNGNDSLDGADGNDTLLGGDGGDEITAGNGNDTVLSGNGNDTVSCGAGDDSVFAGNGEDSLLGEAGNDTLNGDGGTDTISGGDDDDAILGGEMNDRVSGDAGDDLLNGQGGNDTLDGGADDDHLLGGVGDDSLLGNIGNDTLNGQAGNDTLNGNDDDDLLLGGAGNDSIELGAGDDTGLGQAGNDTLIGSAGADSMDGGTGNDLIRSEQVQAVPPPTLSINDVTVNESSGTFTAFSTNFDGGVPAEFSGVTTLAGVQGFVGLGTGANVFAGNLLHNNSGGSQPNPGTIPQTPTTLTLTGLPTHSSIEINFLLAIINSWDGLAGNSATPDFFNIRVDGTAVFRPNFDNFQSPATQGYQPPLGVALTPQPLIDRGFPSSPPGNPPFDSAWNVGLDTQLNNITHSASTLTIEFFADGAGVEGGSNESWGIDNLQVILNGTTTATFTASLSKPASSAITVNYTTNDGTANAGSDYTLTANTLTFAPGVTQQTFSVPVFNDGINETAEDFLVNLSNPTNAVLLDGQGVGTILDNDAPPPQLFGIGTQDSPGELFRVNPTTAATTTVGTINFLNMIGITADPSGNIFSLNSGSNRLVQIDPYTGFATQIATLNPPTNFQEGDLAYDVSNNSIVTVSTGGPPVLARVDVATGAVTSIGNLQTSAGTNIAGTVQVDGLAFRGPSLFAIITGGATGNDAALNDNLILINTQTGVLTNVGDLGFDLGTRAGFAYDRINDVFYAADGVSGTLYRVNPATGAATVIGPLGRGNVNGLAMADVPAAPTLAASISDATFNPEGNSGQGSLDFTISLSAVPTSNVTVTFGTSDGSATAGLDYLATSNSVMFTPTGLLTQTIGVTVLGDQLVEPNESFFVTLTGISGSGAVLNRTQALGSIIDDDLPQNDTLLGGDGNDTLIAADGDDFLNGGAGADSIDAGSGNDSILGGAESDTLDGGDGNDTLDGQGGADVVESSAGNDTFVWNGAGDGNDTLTNASGYDTVTVNGSAAANIFSIGQTSIGLLTVTDGATTFVVSATIPAVVINGNGGNDSITVGSLSGVLQTALTINGGDGDDVLSAASVSIGTTKLRLSGGVGNDSLTGSNDDDTLDGGDGADFVLGGLGNDTLVGGVGNDRMNGNEGDDSLTGGDGDDTLRGVSGNDLISGGNGNDLIESGGGNDTSSGDAGADTISGDAGNDSLSGGTGADTLTGGDGADTIEGGSESDLLAGDLDNDLVRGGDGHDTLDGGDGLDTLVGGDGDDSLTGGLGNDGLNGGHGNDTLNGGAGRDSILGGDGNDVLLGGADADTCLGGDGDDTINGQGSTDLLAGNEGNDTLTDVTSVINEAFAFSAAVLTALEA